VLLIWIYFLGEWTAHMDTYCWVQLL
jgi:hypothetical protein